MKTWGQQTNYNIKAYSVENGLSNNLIFDIGQDRVGFLWVATQNGLNRFDGLVFKSFKHIPGNKNSLPSSVITKILFSPSGKLVVKSGLKYVTYDGEKSFSPLLPDHISDSLNVTNISFINDSTLWLTNGINLYVFELNVQRLKLLVPNIQVNYISETNHGISWMCTNAGVCKIDYRIGLLKIIKPPQCLRTLYIEMTVMKTVLIRKVTCGLQYIIAEFLE